MDLVHGISRCTALLLLHSLVEELSVSFFTMRNDHFCVMLWCFSIGVLVLLCNPVPLSTCEHFFAQVYCLKTKCAHFCGYTIFQTKPPLSNQYSTETIQYHKVRYTHICKEESTVRKIFSMAELHKSYVSFLTKVITGSFGTNTKPICVHDFETKTCRVNN